MLELVGAKPDTLTDSQVEEQMQMFGPYATETTKQLVMFILDEIDDDRKKQITDSIVIHAIRPILQTAPKKKAHAFKPRRSQIDTELIGQLGIVLDQNIVEIFKSGLFQQIPEAQEVTENPECQELTEEEFRLLEKELGDDPGTEFISKDFLKNLQCFWYMFNMKKESRLNMMRTLKMQYKKMEEGKTTNEKWAIKVRSWLTKLFGRHV